MSKGKDVLDLWFSGPIGKTIIVIVLLAVGPLGWVALAIIVAIYFITKK